MTKEIEPIDVRYELEISPAGDWVLTCGGEVMWVSDGDEAYLAEFGEARINADDEAECEGLLDWLEDEGYIPPDCDVSIVKGEADAPGKDI